MQDRTWREMLAGAALTALVALSSGCGTEPTGPAAPPLSPSDAAQLSVASNRVTLAVGDTLQLPVETVSGGAQRPAATAAPLKVTFSTSGSYTEAILTSSAEFDATEIDDQSVTLGTIDGPRVPAATRQNGSLIKVTTGGRFGGVRYYFLTSQLSTSGNAPQFSSLVFEARHAVKGLVRGTINGALPAAPAPERKSWYSLAPAIVSVGASGLAVAHAPGSAILTYGNASALDTLRVTVTAPVVTPPPVSPAPPVASAGDFVRYVSADVEAILGPQLVAGAASNPWSWFDTNAVGHADKLWGASGAGLKDRSHGYYYDAALVQYTTYYRTGNGTALQRARELADLWYANSLIEKEKYGSYSPRESAISGLMLRALDGRPEMWPYITDYTRGMFQMWVGRNTHLDGLAFGVRDGGYMLLYAAQLAQVHPDGSVRAEFRKRAVDAATKYYARLQAADGGWYWKDGSEPWEQPFMVGLLLEGLIEVHQLSHNPVVERAILKSVAHLWTRYRKDERVPESAARGAAWRQVGYFNFPDGRVQGENHLAGATATREGWDTNTIREGRQRNSLVVHAFGYAYHLTKDTKYLTWGDEIFSATYGKGSGPGADAFYGLGDFRGKEYNQAYRSAGRYLAWRAGR